MRHSGISFQGFYLLRQIYAIIVLQDYLNYKRPLFLLLNDFWCCPFNLSMEYFEAHRFLVSTIGVTVPWFS